MELLMVGIDLVDSGLTVAVTVKHEVAAIDSLRRTGIFTRSLALIFNGLGPKVVSAKDPASADDAEESVKMK